MTLPASFLGASKYIKHKDTIMRSDKKNKEMSEKIESVFKTDRLKITQEERVFLLKLIDNYRLLDKDDPLRDTLFNYISYELIVVDRTLIINDTNEPIIHPY